MADTHLGYRQYNLSEREEDFYKALHKAIDKIIEIGCDVVVHSGDLFEESKPSIKALINVRDAIERLADAGIRFIAIAGNHDIVLRKDVIPPHALYKKIIFLTRDSPFYIYRDVFFAGLPYHSKAHSSLLLKHLKKISLKANEYEKRVLILHQAISKYFSMSYEIEYGEIPKNFHYYAMGHIHNRIIDKYGLGYLAYPGSLEIWRTDEIEDYKRNGKGFFIFDIDEMKIDKVDIEPRKFVRIVLDGEKYLKGIERINCDSDAVVEVKIKCKAENYNRIYEKILKDLKNTLHIIIRREDKEDLQEIKIEEKSIDEMEREIIEKYMKNYNSNEIEFALIMLKYLKKGEIEEAKAFADDFFEKLINPENKKKEKLLNVKKEDLDDNISKIREKDKKHKELENTIYKNKKINQNCVTLDDFLR